MLPLVNTHKLEVRNSEIALMVGSAYSRGKTFLLNVLPVTSMLTVTQLASHVPKEKCAQSCKNNILKMQLLQVVGLRPVISLPTARTSNLKSLLAGSLGPQPISKLYAHVR